MPFWTKKTNATTQQQPVKAGTADLDGGTAHGEPGVAGAATRGAADGVAKGVGFGFGTWVWNQAKNWFGISE